MESGGQTREKWSCRPIRDRRSIPKKGWSEAEADGTTTEAEAEAGEATGRRPVGAWQIAPLICVNQSLNPVIVVPLSRYGTPSACEISWMVQPPVRFPSGASQGHFYRRSWGASREKGERDEREGRARARDGSIAAVEIEITRLSAHPSYQDGRRFPLKVHQARANPFRLPPPGSPLRSPPPPARIRRRNNIVGCYDNRAASRRIAPHRAKPPRKLALLHHNDFSLSLSLSLPVSLFFPRCRSTHESHPSECCVRDSRSRIFR